MDTRTEKELADIRNTLCHARLCHEAWWIFTGHHPKRDEIIWALNYYVDFFGTVRPALFVTFILKLTSLFDQASDSISLHSIPDIKTYPEYQDLWNRGRVLYRYRSKAIAHRDQDISEKNFGAETGFVLDDFKKLLDDSCAIFNLAATKLGIESIPNFSCSSDLERLVNDLDPPKRISAPV